MRRHDAHRAAGRSRPARSKGLSFTLALLVGGAALGAGGPGANPALPPGFNDPTDAAFCLLASSDVGPEIPTEGTKDFPLGSTLPAGTALHVENPTLTIVVTLGPTGGPPEDEVWAIGEKFTVHNVSGADINFSDVILVFDLEFIEEISPGVPGPVLQLVPQADPGHAGDPDGDFAIQRVAGQSSGATPPNGTHNLAMGFVEEDVPLFGSPDAVTDSPLRAYKMAPLGILPAGSSVTFNLIFDYEVPVGVDPFASFAQLTAFSFSAKFLHVIDEQTLVEFIGEELDRLITDGVIDLTGSPSDPCARGQDMRDDLMEAEARLNGTSSGNPRGALTPLRNKLRACRDAGGHTAEEFRRLVALGELVQDLIDLIPNTPVGTDVTVVLDDPPTESAPITVTFTEVLTAGVTTVTASTAGPAPPVGFLFEGTYYEITTTATFTGPIEVCVTQTGAGTPILEHYEGSPPAWIDVTNATQTMAGFVCGTVTTFSPFIVVHPQQGEIDSRRADIRFGRHSSRVHSDTVIELPAGIHFSDVDPTAVVDVRVAGKSVVPASNASVAFDVAGKHGDLWRFHDNDITGGVRRFAIYWTPPRFRFGEHGFPIRFRSRQIGSDETVLDLRVSRKQLDGALSFTIAGSVAATVEVTADGAVSANVPVEAKGRHGRVTLTLPFALRDGLQIVFSGSEDRVVQVADHYTGSVGWAHLDTRFDATLLPDGAESEPRSLGVKFELGTRRFLFDTELDPDELEVKRHRWRQRRHDH